ncbi:hypothetical protein [Vulcanococcus sp. Clear-D1]|uniref:hypothetical protein n=1 Tax=Vulcanococcus sp. Clear-D1 TaxID=2766970 RepID=UPI0019852E49|nr:hypothetical protein [Vulcanococcus sp. Clear-D1]MBD1193072.1 hypothetical protein [Vulcanococcus sp. Clear-D1]
MLQGATEKSLHSVPLFLEKAAGFSPSDPVVVTFYGGNGSRHLRWRSRNQGGGAQPVVWSNSIYEEVASRLGAELRDGRQLGFIAAYGGSKKNQITHLNALRAEIDLPDSHELQRQVYAAVEQRYGIRFTLLETGGKSIHAWIPLTTPIAADQYRSTSAMWHELIVEVAKCSVSAGCSVANEV